MKKTTSRRGNNEGSIYQRIDGLWVGSASIGFTPEGKRIRKAVYGKTRAEVVKKLSTIVQNNLLNSKLDLRNENFEIIMEQWLKLFKRATVSGRTFERNMGTARLHIYPKIGQMKLQEISSMTIQSLLNEMLFENYSLASIRKVKHLLNQFFDYAKKCNYVLTNPVIDCKIKTNSMHTETKRENYKAIPTQIRKEFLLQISHHPLFGPLCYTILYSGLRIGEALALKWKDIDFNKRTIFVDNAITEVPEFDKNMKVIARKTVISDTKTTASVRTIPMPDQLCEILKEHKEKRNFLSQIHNVNLTDDEAIVFGNDDGTVRSYSGTRSMFRRFLKLHKMDKYNIHFHTLRHTYSTMLFELEENPKVIQQLLGHKKVTTTLAIYNSIDQSYFEEARNKLSKIIENNEIKIDDN